MSDLVSASTMAENRKRTGVGVLSVFSVLVTGVSLNPFAFRLKDQRASPNLLTQPALFRLAR
jgi:hypothetical protein